MQLQVESSPLTEESASATAPGSVVSATANGRIVESNAYRVAATGAWRMSVRVKQLRPTEPTELRGFLQSGADVLSETWSAIVPAAGR